MTGETVRQIDEQWQASAGRKALDQNQRMDSSFSPDMLQMSLKSWHHYQKRYGKLNWNYHIFYVYDVLCILFFIRKLYQKKWRKNPIGYAINKKERKSLF